MKRFLLAFALLWGVAAFGQSTQIATGPADPATCDPTVGQLFFNNSTTPAVLKYCSATNTWSAVGGASGTLFPWTVLGSSGTPALAVNNGSVNYYMSVTGDISAVTTSGSATNGTYLGIDFQEDGTGGHAIPTAAFPGNFIFPTGCTFSTTPNANNWLAWTYDGTNWQPVPGVCSSGGSSLALKTNGSFNGSQTLLNLAQGSGVTLADNGSGTVTITNSGGTTTGSANVLQKTDGSGGHVATNLTESGSNLTIDDSPHIKGPEPWVDVTRYGVRATTSTPSTTCTISATSTSATCADLSSFVKGDGINVYGAGASNVMATPSAPTVTPSIAAAGTNTGLVANSASGSTTNQYCIMGWDSAGGHTACSTVGTTNTAQASLGQQSATITNIVLANQTVTVTISTPHSFAVGCTNNCGQVTIIGTPNDKLFAGTFAVASAPTTTTFTYLSHYDTRAGASGTAISGGTATWYNVNHIVASGPLTGNFIYVVYGRTNGTMNRLGFMLPQNSSLTQATDSTYLTFDDLGSTMTTPPNAPSYIPATAPVSATNDNLVTTISSIAGNTATLANAAVNSVSNATSLLDNTPNAQTAFAASNTQHSATYFPTTAGGNRYYFNSVLTVPNYTRIQQAGDIYLNETVLLPGSFITWNGASINVPCSTAPSFSTICAPTIYVNAPIGLYIQNNANINNLVIVAQSPNQNMLLLKDGGNPSMFRDLMLSATSGLGDYMSRAIVYRGNSNGAYSSFGDFFENINLLDLNPNQNMTDSTPAMILSYSGVISKISHVWMARRGILVRPPNYGSEINTDWLYTQGNISPIFTVFGDAGGTSGVSINLHNIHFDTTGVAAVTNLNTPVGGHSSVTLTIDALQFSPAGTNSWATGPYIYVDGSRGTPGTKGTASSIQNGAATDGVYATNGSTSFDYPQVRNNASLAISIGYPIFSTDAQPAAPTCTVTTAGPPFTQARTWSGVQYSVIYANGGAGTISAPMAGTCTTDGTTQQATFNIPTPIPGTIALQWYWNNFLLACSSSTTTSCLASAGLGSPAPSVTAGGPVGFENKSGTGLAWSNIFNLGQYMDVAIGTSFGNPASGFGRVSVDTVTQKLKCVLSTGVDCSPSPASFVSTFTGDSLFFSNSGSTGPVTLTPQNFGAYALPFNNSASPGLLASVALSSLPAAQFPTLNQNTTGSAGTLTGCTGLAAKGDLCIYTGSTWARFAGNSSGSAVLTEDATGTASWGSGASTSFQANGTPLTSASTVNFQNSAAFNGLTATFSNPSAGNVQLGLSGTLTNAGLANPATTVNGQTCTLGSTCTVPFQTNTVNNTSQAGINLLTSTANVAGLTVTPTNSATNADKFEVSGIVNNSHGGTGQDSSGATGIAQVNSGTWSFATSVPSGTTGTTPTTSPCDNSTKVATTAFVAACGGTFSSPMTGFGDMITGGSGGAAQRLAGGLTGQTVVFTNGAPAAAASPSLTDSTNSPVSGATYTIACDTGTAIVDRAHTVRFTGSGATVTVPVSSASGCPGLVTTLEDVTGNLTVNSSGSDTFTVLNGGTALTAQTSFGMTPGQYATLKQGAASLWEVEIKTGGVGSIVANSPLSGSGTSVVTLTCPTCVTSGGSLTSTAIMTGAGSQGSQTPSGSSTLDSSGNMSLAGTLGVTGLATATGGVSNPKTGAASTSASTWSGDPYTGGTATTNFPLVYRNHGSAVSTFSTAGTYDGWNAVSGFTGNFLDFHVNGGASVAKLDYQGNLTVNACTGCASVVFSFPITVSGTVTSGGIPYFNSTTQASTSALLTANSPVLGGGAGAAPKTVAGITTDGTSALTLGVAGSSVGSVVFNNATSGSVTLKPVTGALGSVTVSLPAATGTVAVSATSPLAESAAGAISINANGITATQLAAQYSKGSCTEVWGGSGTSFALTSGDDAISNNTCYNDSGVTRTITAVKCLSDSASNTTTVNPTFGAAGTGTTILSGALTCGSSNAMSSSGTVSNASWTTGTGIDPAMSGTLTGTHIAMIVEYTF